MATWYGGVAADLLGEDEALHGNADPENGVDHIPERRFRQAEHPGDVACPHRLDRQQIELPCHADHRDLDHQSGENIDRVTVANELMKFNELEACDGLSYLVSLDDGMPHIANLESYVKIVRDKATLRRIVHASQHLMNRALMAEEEPGEILSGAGEALLKLGETRQEKGLMTPLEVIQNYQGGLNAFLDPSKRIKGISTGFTKLDEMTGGLHAGDGRCAGFVLGQLRRRRRAGDFDGPRRR